VVLQTVVQSPYNASFYTTSGAAAELALPKMLHS